MEDQNIPDEETQRLLDELGDREQLEKRAKELDVKFRDNIGDDTLRQRVADAVKALNPGGENSSDGESTDGEESQSDQDNESGNEPESEDAVDPDGNAGSDLVVDTEEDENCPPDELLTITNNGKNLRRIEGVELAAGDSCTLTEGQMSNKSLMSKVNRMIELGIFARA